MSSKLDRLIASYNSMECEFNVDKSIEVCKEILKINPNLIEFQENLACDYYEKKEYEKSIELFNKCMENGGVSDSGFLMIALTYIKMNEIAKALEILKETKNKERYLLNHLIVYRELEEYENAIEYGDKLLDLNPENTLALHHMSEIYDEIDDSERSMFYYNELANVVPSMKSAVLIRLYSLGKYDELIESFEEQKQKGIFERDLESAHFNYIIGMSYQELNRPFDSLKYLLNSDRLYSTAEKKAAIAKNYIENLKFALAHKYLNEALKIDEMNESSLFLITETSYYLGNYYEAIEYANKLLSNYQCDKVFHVLGAIYFDLGDTRNAFESIKVGTHVMIENWDYSEGPYSEYIMEIAKRLSKAEYAERAENIYNKLLSKHPDYYTIYLERAKHYKRVGKTDLAEKDFEKYNEYMMEEEREWKEFLKEIGEDEEEDE
ncbi:MAG: hypothetical protein J6W71_06260 [Methanobrevibacter sp.]|nr:hypothetical protein [Methanobrevibacter sp.]